MGNILHHLVICPSLASRNDVLFEYWDKISVTSPHFYEILRRIKKTNPEHFLQFVLDCSAVPKVIAATQAHGESIYSILYKATRTYCYSMYRARLKLLNQWI